MSGKAGIPMTQAGSGLSRAQRREGDRGNVVLIGMPGAGKSTLGVVLAKIMGKGFLDADLVIQSRYGKTLARLIDEQGIDGFLEMENQVLAGLDVSDTVISTGGSAVYSSEAMAALRASGTVVYLHVETDELASRLGDLTERGVVMRDGMTDDLEALAAERTPLYRRYADLEFDSVGPSIRVLAHRLAERLEGQPS